MSGKLPIDRAREAQDAPRIYEEQKQQYSEEQAYLRKKARQHGESAQPDAEDEDNADRT